MEQFEPNDLYLFARVVEAGSFSRAAERLGLPKSTVSRRLAGLEERLGERVLLRTTRRLRLTEFGTHLLEHARQVVEEVDAVRALAEHRRARPSGRLRVSMPSDFAGLLLVDMLAAFSALHPEVMLELDLSPRRVDIVGENFDLALRMGALPDDTLLAARRIASMSMGLYAAPAYLAEHGDPETPEALAVHRALVLPASAGGPRIWTLIHDTLQRDIQPTGRIAANSPELLLGLAAAGAGIAAVPDHFARARVVRGELRRVLPRWHLPPHDAWAVFPGRRLMPAKTRAFLDMLESALAGACAEELARHAAANDQEDSP
ncbi:LysR family transcriptional regulator [Pseudothauera nasutitermitis]|uniref:LysR family transcriptional regulator n=1 Tax=Pseudothauera nasutitermitis TaxID=2565930 RepID=A0A4S4B2J1_9RHOO|nr:LysR family transcriptional regulator [Pseudothauera nasutitermitis]THF65907.1 LysR family transcriptional regulator [Pseudothauera nasutitermitis]